MWTKNAEHSASYALMPMLTLVKAKNELAQGAIALIKHDNASATMKHVFEAKKILAGLDHELELLARECELIANGHSKAFERVYRSRKEWETFLNLWRSRLFPKPTRPRFNRALLDYETFNREHDC